MARRLKEGDEVRGVATMALAIVVEDEEKSGHLVVRYRDNGRVSPGVSSSYRLVKKRASQKDRDIASLRERLREVGADRDRAQRELVAREYAEDQRLLQAGFVRIDFLRQNIVRGTTIGSSDGIEHHFTISERNGRRNGALLKAFLKELKK